MGTMKKNRYLSIILVVVMLLSVMTFGACKNEEDYIPPTKATIFDDYDISGVTLSIDNSEEDITFNKTVFVPMSFKEGNYSMEYRVSFPSNYNAETPTPVLMFFHGAGERGNDNNKQITTYLGFKGLFADETSPLLDSIIIAPQCPTNEQWVDVPNWGHCQYSTESIAESKAMTAALKILKCYTEDYNVDIEKIYSMGLSMGGYATWDLLVRHNEVFAAAIPICGGCDTSKAEVLKNTPIYTFHGAKDSVVGSSGTKVMADSLRTLGNKNFNYVEYPNDDHLIWDKAMSTNGLMDWLYSKSLSSRL